nr:hypothetical protein [Paenarthrobacter nicotinovorans]
MDVLTHPVVVNSVGLGDFVNDVTHLEILLDCSHDVGCCGVSTPVGAASGVEHRYPVIIYVEGNFR